MPKTCTLAIDVGGTFTDITFADAATGATWVAKTPSTPGDLSAGFITAVRKVLALAGRAPADVLRVFHGTTTATNSILEGKTPPTALVTTSGFKYVLEIGRHDIPRHGNLYGWSKPTRPITPERVFVWNEVQRANMAKVGLGGVKKREDGKVLKPDGWTPPDVEKAVFGPRFLKGSDARIVIDGVEQSVALSPAELAEFGRDPEHQP